MNDFKIETYSGPPDQSEHRIQQHRFITNERRVWSCTQTFNLLIGRLISEQISCLVFPTMSRSHPDSCFFSLSDNWPLIDEVLLWKLRLFWYPSPDFPFTNHSLLSSHERDIYNVSLRTLSTTRVHGFRGEKIELTAEISSTWSVCEVQITVSHLEFSSIFFSIYL